MGLLSRVKTWVSGNTLTASDLNAEFDNILNNLDPDHIEDASADATAMQATADPYPGGAESLATSTRGELQRLRYLIKQITGETNWYVDPDTDIANLTTALSVDNFSNFRKLVIKNNASLPNYKMDITATNAVLFTSAGVPKKFSSVNLTGALDITVSGAGGLDTGAEANSTWYHMWVIGKTDGTVAGLFSLADSNYESSVTMPSGYTYKAYAGAVYNNASGNFLTTYQMDNKARCLSGYIALSNANPTLADLSAFIPSTAKSVRGTADPQGATILGLHPVTFTAGIENVFFYSSATGEQEAIYCPIETAATIYFITTVGQTVNLYIRGWEY